MGAISLLPPDLAVGPSETKDHASAVLVDQDATGGGLDPARETDPASLFGRGLESGVQLPPGQGTVPQLPSDGPADPAEVGRVRKARVGYRVIPRSSRS